MESALSKDNAKVTGSEEEWSVILDYANAVEIGEVENQTTDVSKLNTSVKKLDTIINGTTSDKYDNNTNLLYREDVIDELKKEDGLYEQAKAVLENADATQKQVDDMTNEIERYLASKKTILTYLREARKEAAALTEGDYTKASWNAYMESVNDATKLAYCCDGDRDVDGNFKVSWPDIDWKNKYGSEVDGSNPSAGWQLAGELGEYITVQDNTTQAAKQNLVSVKELKEALNTAKSVEQNEDKYSSAQYAKLQKAIQAAETLTTTEDTVTAQQISNAIEDLTKCTNSALVDISGLKAAITNAKTISNDDNQYSKGSYNKLQVAITAAEAVLTTEEDLTDEAVANAVTTLTSAQNNLVVISDLKAVMDQAEELLTKTDQYTEASLTAVKEALNSAKIFYKQSGVTQTDIDNAKTELQTRMNAVVEKSSEGLDKNNLADGVYTVSVNLWKADSDAVSMGDSALDHTATLTVKVGKYTLRISGHATTMSGQTGALDAFRVVPDGSEPNGSGSNYKEAEVITEGNNCYTEFEITNPTAVTDYYYSGIKVHTVDASGNIGYPMGTNWVANRLRISWDTLAAKDVQNYPAFSATDAATGITVTAKEGALPKGTTLKVTKVTDQTRLAEVSDALSNLAAQTTPYEVKLLDANGNEIEPQNNMELTVTLPYTDGYNTARAACYYLDGNNYANMLSVLMSSDNKQMTVNNSKTGTYVVAEKKARATTYTINTSNSKVNGTATGTGTKTATTGTGVNGATKTATVGSVKTGDEMNMVTWMMTALGALTAAAGVVVFRKRRKDTEETK